MKKGQVFPYKRIILKIMISLILILLLSSLNSKTAKAQEKLPVDIDYDEIQDVISDVLNKGNEFNFEDYVNRLINGQEVFSLKEIANRLIYTVKGEINANINTFGRLISIALIAAIFTNLSIAFKNSQVSETGYYITYLMMFGLLVSSFISASLITSKAINAILSFMRALVPAYFLSVGFCSGSATSLMFYEASLIMITVVDFVLLKVVIPLINFYLIITLANNLSKEDMLSKLAGLFSTAISWMLKSLLAAVIGFHTIQGLIVPVVDQVKRSTLLRASQAMPGVGNAISGVAETVLSAGVLLKNAIGVTGLIIILAIGAVPFIKLLIITLIYKAGSAAVQPISDKRVVECISCSAKSAGMLLQTLSVGAVLFLISITIVAVTTSGTR